MGGLWMSADGILGMARLVRLLFTGLLLEAGDDWKPLENSRMGQVGRNHSWVIQSNLPVKQGHP